MVLAASFITGDCVCALCADSLLLFISPQWSWSADLSRVVHCFSLNPLSDSFHLPPLLNTDKQRLNILCIFKFHEDIYVQQGQIEKANSSKSQSPKRKVGLQNTSAASHSSIMFRMANTNSVINIHLICLPVYIC